ncbi:hypothetical protein RJD38_21110 [Vibrio scophthalmi]|uniref:hypothetical protein n=1 Tax=Vibrio scophthalmi TaxID=45658 RepID=UPI00349F1F51
MSEIKLINATNLYFANEDKTAIFMIVEVEGVAEIIEPVEFVASAFDVMPHGVEWYKRARLGEFGTVNQYEPYVPTEADLLEKAKMFFESEKEIALKINADYHLDLKPILDEEMQEVKTYLKAIVPDSIARHTRIARSIPRPEIMNKYAPLNATLEE